MNSFINLRISAKIAVVASFMAPVSLGITLFAIDTMRTYNAFNDATVSAARRSTSAEKVNGLINAVVMDSRGVYMSLTTAEATRYGNGILAWLKQLDVEMAKWATAVRPEQRDAQEKERADVAARETRARHMMELIKQFNTDVTQRLAAVGASVARLNESATTMSTTAEETARQANAVAAASEEASTNVQTVASATEEMTSSIREISAQVSSSSENARRAVDQSARANTKVQGLAEAAQRIGAVVKLIGDIASRTNLLALNATIEAARAGDAGKGFAVVASEVKSLANQTAKATEEISQQIAEIQSETGASVQAIESIGGTIREIDRITAAIAAAIEEQAAGTQEVSSNIVGVNAAADQSGRVAGSVRDAAGTLSGDASALRKRIDGFLGEVAAA